MRRQEGFGGEGLGQHPSEAGMGMPGKTLWGEGDVKREEGPGQGGHDWRMPHPGGPPLPPPHQQGAPGQMPHQQQHQGFRPMGGMSPRPGLVHGLDT